VVSHETESALLAALAESPSILAVDDHPGSLMALQAVLAPLGHELVTCNSGEEALRHLMTRDFAVIILDVQMPGLDGFTTAQIIKERTKSRDIPIIFVTATSRDSSQIFRGYSHGAVDYLLKPFDPEILRSKVAVFVQLFLQKLKIKEQAALLREREREASDQKMQELLAREKAAREEAQAANRMKDEFLATVSHELRTPLTAMLGWTRIIRGGKLDSAKLAHGLSVIERSGRAQAAIIDDILDASRIITGKLRLDLDAVDLGSVVQAAMDTVRPAADAKGISVDWKCGTTVPRFSGDPDRLQQIIWNLLSNATKFTPRGGRVEIASSYVDSSVEITVTDTGQGISADFLPHVFDRFRQADGTSTRRHGGLGLGLAIVRHLVELHGGTVDAESAGEGQGARFTIKLPVTPGQLPPPAKRTDDRAMIDSNEVPLTLSGMLVLVADPHPDARDLITTMLEQAGANVIAVSTSDEAIDVLSRASPSVLLSAAGTPPDGYLLVRRLRELPAHKGGRIPAIALTAYSRGEDTRRALEAGFQGQVAKPIDPDVLVKQVAALAGRRV
jgi:signal transduction histidine kinase